MTATQRHSSQASVGRLFVGFEMGWSKVKVVSTCSAFQKPRIREVPARDLAALRQELAKAKARFGLPASAPVHSCYEAGRDGFWLHRWLVGQQVDNVVIDPGSIKVNQRRKKAKTDRLDGQLLLSNLLDFHGGKRDVWSVVRVPTLAQEDQRQLHRELETVQGERTEHVNRLKSILATLGLKVEKIDQGFEAWLGEQRLLETGQAIPPDHRRRLVREYRRWQLTQQQVVELELEQQRRVASRVQQETEPAREQEGSLLKVRRLMRLKGIGIKSAWLFGHEFFGWRRFQNRRQVGSLAGLTPTPYESGTMSRELGLNKAGNRWVRSLIVEIAWGWLRWQPESGLAQWFAKRYGKGGYVARKKGIVALARKLLIALWRWVEFDVKPEGALEVSWESKVKGCFSAA
jgi:transposase